MFILKLRKKDPKKTETHRHAENKANNERINQQDAEEENKAKMFLQQLQKRIL
jgi:hypothetical protein